MAVKNNGPVGVIPGNNALLDNNDLSKGPSKRQPGSRYTPGGEYLLPNGKEYVGGYHIGPDGHVMVGKVHTSTPHPVLTRIDGKGDLPRSQRRRRPRPGRGRAMAQKTDCIQEEGISPDVSFSKITLEENSSGQGMIVTSEIFIQDEDAGRMSGWMDEEFFGKHLKIKVIQSTSTEITQKILNEQGKFKSLTSLRNGKGYSYQEFSIIDVLQGKLESQYKTINDDGNTTWNIPFTFQFKIEKTSDPKHLSYFAFSYFDLNNLGIDLNLPESLQEVVGQTEYRVVIKDFSISGDSDMVVQDFRSVDRLNELQIQPDLLENKALRRIESSGISTSDRIKIEGNQTYLSNFFIARDKNGSSRFFFSLDLQKWLFENSAFGSYFTNAPDLTIDDIINRSKINLLKVTRRRVVPLPGSNRLGSPAINEKIFDKNQPTEVIVSTSEKNGIIEAKTGWGTIRETDITPDPELKYVRHFTGVDFDVSGQTFGHFQYGVEIEIEDGTVDYVSKIYSELLEARSGLDEYINILNIPRVYDLPKKVLNLDSEYAEKISPVIKKYFDTVSIWFSRGRNLQINKAHLMVSKVTDPKTRSIKGILTFSKLVDNLLRKLETTLNAVSSVVVGRTAESNPATNRARSGGSSGVAKRVLRLEKIFPELFDSDMPKNIGFDYLSTSRDDRDVGLDGLKVIIYSKFVERLTLEMSKHFVSAEKQLEVNINGQSFALNTHINTTPIHFAPSMVILGKTKKSFINEGIDLWERGVNDLAASQILSYKRTGIFYSKKPSEASLAGPSPMSEREQEIKNYLTNTVDSFSLTVLPPVRIRPQSAHTSVNETIGLGTWKTDTKSETIKDYSADPGQDLNTNSLFSNLVLGLATTNASSAKDINVIPDRATSFRQQNGFKMDLLNPQTTNNIFSSNINGRGIDEILSIMPLQIKSIVAAATLDQGGGTVYDWSRLPEDPLSDPRTINAFVFNYLLLQGVEYLSGYEISAEGEILIKQPIWLPATLEALSTMGETEIFCRLRRFEDSDIPSINSGEGLDLPSYNEYFIIRPNSMITGEERKRIRRRRKRRTQQARDLDIANERLVKPLPSKLFKPEPSALVAREADDLATTDAAEVDPRTGALLTPGRTTTATTTSNTIIPGTTSKGTGGKY